MSNRSGGLINALTTMVHTINSNIQTKFRAYYLKRIHETDLAPTKTYSYDFDIESHRTNVHRSSVSRLKGLISKHLLKNHPVVALAENEFFHKDNNSGVIAINLFELELGATLPQVHEKGFKVKLRENRLDDRNINDVTYNQIRDYERLGRSVVESTVKYRSVKRYLKFLQYLALKNGVPVSLSLKYNRNNVASGDTSLIYRVHVEVMFTGWIPATRDAVTRHAAVLDGGTDDALFSNIDWWSYGDLNYLTSESPFHMSKFFFHLDKAIKVVSTLTRKIDYGYNAFSFKSA